MLARDLLRESNRVRQERSDAWSKAGDEIEQDLWIWNKAWNGVGVQGRNVVNQTRFYVRQKAWWTPLASHNSRGQVLQQLGPLASPFIQRHSQWGGLRGPVPLKYYFYCFYFVAIMINFVLDNHLILMRMYRVCFCSSSVEITVFCLFTLLLIERHRT